MKLNQLLFFIGMTIISLNTATTQTMQEHDDKSKKILQMVSDETEKNITTKIKFSLTIKGEDINESQNGFAFLKGEKFYYKTKGTDDSSEVICNGNTIWTHMFEDQECYIDNLEDIDNAINPKEIFTIWKSGFNYKYVDVKTIENQNIHTIKMFPSDPSKSKYHTVLLKVNENKKQIKSAIIKTKNGIIIQFDIKGLKSNPTLNDNIFVWSKDKYPNVDIIDNR
ncbi:MAG: hypothetical protein CL846_06405 [Crocinitomicaceae bacterium]|nr:hypothetical protein [Crocinitomicaceae bacterium]|tara:strand:+ start:9022 stop:9693 length:672 start_codon:yes stop_codon:yes gene_type:complete